MRRLPLGLVAVLAGLVLVTGTVSAVAGPGQRRPVPDLVEVESASAVCPDVKQDTFLQTRVSVGAAPLPAGRTAAGGQVTSSQVTGLGTAVVPVLEPGQVAVNQNSGVNNDGVVVNATGALATGLEVEQIARGRDGRFRGLAGLRCAPPQREAWFVGADTGILDESILILANIDDTPATVDVTVFGAKGLIDSRPGQGLTVRPHERLLVNLDTLAPGQASMVVHIVSRQGRVAAALRDSRMSGTTQLGFDYLPQALPPATTVVVPGIPGGPGRRVLIVGNPGVDDVAVQMQVTVSDGQFVPEGRNEIDIPAGFTKQIDLTELAASSPVTVRLQSDSGPIVAGGMLVDAQLFQEGPIREIAYAGSATALGGPALLTDLVIDRPTESFLILSAPDTAATVTVTPIRVVGAVGNPPAARTLSVPAGRTIVFRLTSFFPPGTDARLAVEVRPDSGSGPVFATRYLRERGARGTLTTLLTLQGPAQLVARPHVVQDQQAGYGG